MNFFQHQDKARRNTKLLVVLFTVAVFLIGLSIYLATQFALNGAAMKAAAEAGDPVPHLSLWDPETFLWVMVGTVGFIGLASLYRTAKLREGGGAVARMLGGRLVELGTRDRLERRLVNVVEEMAIAAGVPVPEIYILDKEKGINAFAAGFTPDNAAVAVTRGTLEILKRDELQGVIAHEFSHILNGDMRLNIRLIGVLFGILAIAVIGRLIMYSSHFSRRKEGAAPLIIGLVLLIVGYIGVFVGRLIQSAVSRQREFLADSSAVQYTRNPAGISGALKRIAGYESGSYLESPESTEVGHLLFGAGEKVSFMSGLMATHPPIDERIRRLDPSFQPELAEMAKEGPAQAAAAPGLAKGFGGGTVRADPDTVVDRVGVLDEEQLALGASWMSDLPADLHQALESTDGARFLVFALLLDPDEAERARQMEILVSKGGEADANGAAQRYLDVQAFDPSARLPLADLAMPALRRLPRNEAGAFLGMVDALVAADGKVTLFEFALRWLLNHRLRRKGRGRVIYKSMEKVAWNVAHLLAGLASAGHPDDEAAREQAFTLGMKAVPTRQSGAIEHAFGDGSLGSMSDVGLALDRLSLASFKVRERAIDAAAHCALADGVVTVGEAELLRLVAVSLDCPLPPFVTDHV